MPRIKIRRTGDNDRLFDESLKASSLFPPQAYDKEAKIFLMDDSTIGFVCLCEPISGFDQSTQQSMESLFQDTPFPDGSHVQVNWFRSPDIKKELAQIHELRAGNQNRLLNDIIKERIEFFDKHTIERLVRTFKGTRHDQGLIIDQKIVFSVKVPIDGTAPTKNEIAELENLKIETIAALGTIPLRPTIVDAKQYIRLLQTMFNWGENASWRHGYEEYDEKTPISEQIMDYDNDIEYNKDGLKIGDCHVRTLSAKKLPRHAYFGSALNYCGDIFHGISSVKENYMVSMNLYYPPYHKTKSKMERNRTFTINQSQGPIVNYVPVLAEKRDDFNDLNKDVNDDGLRYCQISMNIIIFCPTEKRASEAVSDMRSYWRKNQFEMIPNKMMHHAIFFNSLPLFTDPTAVREMQRYKTLTPKQAAVLAPVFGEWKGTGTPYVSLISRNGQLMSVSKFDSEDNYNSLTAAASGSGKSFATNNEIDSYMSEGARAWVIDQGRSYKNLAEIHGGDFIEFSENSTVCINPFPLVQDYADEEDMLISIVGLMITKNVGLTGFQEAELKRNMQATFYKFGNDMLIDDLAKMLKESNDNRVVDMGIQLFPFTTQGSYGRFFNGKNNISFNQQFTVLELEELRGREHLQSVVLAQMLYQIQQAVYLDQDNRDLKKMVIIDEAWSLLESAANAIETAYRRFRKYGGSITLITQSLLDFDATPLGQTITANANSTQLLGQKKENLEKSIQKGYLSVPKGYETMLQSVKTRQGLYSELFVSGSFGMGIGRLFVSESQSLMYSTRPDDVSDIQRYRNQGLDVAEAIKMVLQERSQEYNETDSLEV